jgi:hypothetical protein
MSATPANKAVATKEAMSKTRATTMKRFMIKAPFLTKPLSLVSHKTATIKLNIVNDVAALSGPIPKAPGSAGGYLLVLGER